jgi:hypothetical protein
MILDTYFFQVLCLPERALIRKVSEVVPPDHPLYRVLAKVLQVWVRPLARVKSPYPEPTPERECEWSLSRLEDRVREKHAYLYGDSMAQSLGELEDLYSTHAELVYTHSDSNGHTRTFQGAGAIDFLYRMAIHSMFQSAKPEESHHKKMKLPVLAYAKCLKKQGRFAAMFRQYYRLVRGLKTPKLALYKTGKYLVAPKRGECVQNRQLGIEMLKKCIDDGLCRAAFVIGRDQIEQNELEEGLESFLLSFKMGCVQGLFAYVDTSNRMGGPRREPAKHFDMLLDAYRSLKQKNGETPSDAKLARDLNACRDRLCDRHYVKYQWKEGIRLLATSVTTPRFLFEAAKANNHPQAERLFSPEHVRFPDSGTLSIDAARV